jgi:type VI secretion system protein ImpH
MGREAQPPHSRLSPRLAADLHRMNFYRFCQLLEKRNPDRPLMGSTSHPADDPVRFAPHPGMGFPGSELKAVEYDKDDDSRPPRIRTTFMGMYGVDSPCRQPISMTSLSAVKGMTRCRAFWIFSATVS